MKLDDDFSFIRVCPKTKKQILYSDYAYSSGICPQCGHDDNSTFTHEEKVVGKWDRPSIFEYLFKGKRKQFLNNDTIKYLNLE